MFKHVLYAITVICAGLCLMAQNQAHANFNVWQDDVTGLVLSYPDTWRTGLNQQPDDIFTIHGPSADGMPSCRVRVRDDKRFQIYPPELSPSVQRVGYSAEFWGDYLTEFADPVVYQMRDYVGFGKGVGSQAVASFRSSIPGKDMRRKAMIFAANYYDRLYLFECTVAYHAYDFWRPRFLSIAKTIDFRKTHHELYTGEYHDFLNYKRVYPGYDAQGLIYY